MKRGKTATQAKTLEDLTPVELVIAILEAGEIKQLPGSFSVIHYAFGWLRTEFPDALERFIFNLEQYESFHFCQLLNDVLCDLLESKIIDYQSDPDIYVVHRGSITKAILKSLARKDQKIMEKAGTALVTILQKIDRDNPGLEVRRRLIENTICAGLPRPIAPTAGNWKHRDRFMPVFRRRQLQR